MTWDPSPLSRAPRLDTTARTGRIKELTVPSREGGRGSEGDGGEIIYGGTGTHGVFSLELSKKSQLLNRGNFDSNRGTSFLVFSDNFIILISKISEILKKKLIMFGRIQKSKKMTLLS